MVRRAELLDDQAMRQFIRDGYVSVRAELPRSFHDDIYQRLERVTAEEGTRATTCSHGS